MKNIPASFGQKRTAKISFKSLGKKSWIIPPYETSHLCDIKFPKSIYRTLSPGAVSFQKSCIDVHFSISQIPLVI